MADYTKPLCARCKLRPREEGGTASCPFLSLKVSGVPLQSKYAKLGEGEFECLSYKPGSRREKTEVVLPDEGLF